MSDLMTGKMTDTPQVPSAEDDLPTDTDNEGSEDLDISSEGVKMPDVEVGQEFELPSKFVKKDDATICLVEVGGKRLTDDSNEESEGEDQPVTDQSPLNKLDQHFKDKFNSYGK